MNGQTATATVKFLAVVPAEKGITDCPVKDPLVEVVLLWTILVVLCTLLLQRAVVCFW